VDMMGGLWESQWHSWGCCCAGYLLQEYMCLFASVGRYREDGDTFFSFWLIFDNDSQDIDAGPFAAGRIYIRVYLSC
jgi:hypothetical protein